MFRSAWSQSSPECWLPVFIELMFFSNNASQHKHEVLYNHSHRNSCRSMKWRCETAIFQNWRNDLAFRLVSRLFASVKKHHGMQVLGKKSAQSLALFASCAQRVGQAKWFHMMHIYVYTWLDRRLGMTNETSSLACNDHAKLQHYRLAHGNHNSKLKTYCGSYTGDSSYTRHPIGTVS